MTILDPSRDGIRRGVRGRGEKTNSGSQGQRNNVGNKMKVTLQTASFSLLLTAVIRKQSESFWQHFPAGGGWNAAAAHQQCGQRVLSWARGSWAVRDLRGVREVWEDTGCFFSRKRRRRKRGCSKGIAALWKWNGVTMVCFLRENCLPLLQGAGRRMSQCRAVLGSGETLRSWGKVCLVRWVRKAER